MAWQLEDICQKLDDYIRQITLGRLEQEAMMRLSVEGDFEAHTDECRHLSSLVSARGLIELVLEDQKAKSNEPGEDRAGEDGAGEDGAGEEFSGCFFAVPIGMGPRVRVLEGRGLSLTIGAGTARMRQRCGGRQNVPSRDWNATLYPPQSSQRRSVHIVEVGNRCSHHGEAGTEVMEIEVEEEIGNAANTPKPRPGRAKKRSAE